MSNEAKTNLVKSININEVFDKKTVKEHLNKSLVRVFGVARRIIEAKTKYGTQTGFGGDFFALNLQTGEVFESEAAFLPKGLTSEIERMLEKDVTREAKFSADLQAIPSDKNNYGYAWVAVEPRTEEMLSRRDAMRQEMLKETQKLLSAPAPAKKEEAKPAAKKTAA